MTWERCSLEICIILIHDIIAVCPITILQFERGIPIFRLFAHAPPSPSSRQTLNDDEGKQFDCLETAVRSRINSENPQLGDGLRLCLPSASPTSKDLGTALDNWRKQPYVRLQRGTTARLLPLSLFCFTHNLTPIPPAECGHSWESHSSPTYMTRGNTLRQAC